MYENCIYLWALTRASIFTKPTPEYLKQLIDEDSGDSADNRPPKIIIPPKSFSASSSKANQPRHEASVPPTTIPTSSSAAVHSKLPPGILITQSFFLHHLAISLINLNLWCRPNSDRCGWTLWFYSYFGCHATIEAFQQEHLFCSSQTCTASWFSSSHKKEKKFTSHQSWGPPEGNSAIFNSLVV